MLPTSEEFAKYVGEKLGIDNETEVVVYDSNEIMLATRVWFMFRVFGHERLRVLNGGMRRWKTENRSVTDDETKVQPKTYTARFRPELVLSYEQVLDRVAKKNELQLLDARHEKGFEGEPTDQPGKDKTGHIPNAVNIPRDFMIDNETGLFRSDAELKKVFDQAGVNFSKPVATSCGTGMTATVLAFGAHLLGKETPVYDGSWYEWSRRASDEYIKKG
jgi:thiosulfate/3-mercaptopyruvate sulfurtransferase